jgi:hypothetical protein
MLGPSVPSTRVSIEHTRTVQSYGLDPDQRGPTGLHFDFELLLEQVWGLMMVMMMMMMTMTSTLPMTGEHDDCCCCW